MAMTVTEAYEEMRAHHRALGEQLTQRASVVSSAVASGQPYAAAIGGFVAYLAGEVLPHAAAEERTIYPLAAAHAELAGMVAQMSAEHATMSAAGYRLAILTDGGKAAGTARQIAELFAAHAAKENDVLLPALLTDASVDLVALLGQIHHGAGHETGHGPGHHGTGRHGMTARATEGGPVAKGERIRVRRVYDEVSPDDGFRVLVDRVWPRGLRKADAHLDEWAKDVAPSAELRVWYRHDPTRFDEFRRRYADELAEPGRADAVSRLRARAADGPVTLLTATKELNLSQAAVLAELLSPGELLTRGPDAGAS
jgi:uncharacterized protein YeaO (DUF488 family)/iron-sulfur cluster repair protein YtfE (RIC family)